MPGTVKRKYIDAKNIHYMQFIEQYF
jgi:hypothetical protein